MYDKAGSLNSVKLIGRIGNSPSDDLKYTPSGAAVLNLSIATTGRKKSGESYEDFSEWHRITAWTKLAENIAKYAKKGNRVYVEGSLETRSWEDKDGVKRYTTEIIANRIDLLESRNEQSEQASQPESTPELEDSDSLPF